MIQQGWLEPIKGDDVFEMYTLLRVIDGLGSIGFEQPQRLGLITRNREEVAVLKRKADNSAVYIYFDQSPVSIFKAKSRYQDLIDQYGELRAQPRRPDLTLRHLREGQQRQVLVECKESDDDGYRRDSVYKAFGYVQDFADLWTDNSGQRPKVIVVFPSNLTRYTVAPDDLVLVGADDQEELASLIGSAFSA
jgi:hypothetical protein